MKKEIDTLVFVGRFQPFHNGHKHVIEEALEIAEQVIVIVGSSFAPRSRKNPFTFEERKKMILDVFEEEADRLIVKGVADYRYSDDKWVNVVRNIANEEGGKTTGLIGHSKDKSSFYLNIFPDWEPIEVDNYRGIDATSIRNIIYANKENEQDSSKYLSDIYSLVPPNMRIPELPDQFYEEQEFVAKYREDWKTKDQGGCVPYPVTFVTADSVVCQSGHILLVKRKFMPGKDLWALPGGFLNQDETMIDGAIRELREETKLKVPEPVLKGNIKNFKIFDDPNRSERGRVITGAILINLPKSKDLPKVKASDDAKKAVWIPFDKVRREELFEDHADIIDSFLNIF